jgi:hypothetical protein
MAYPDTSIMLSAGVACNQKLALQVNDRQRMRKPFVYECGLEIMKEIFVNLVIRLHNLTRQDIVYTLVLQKPLPAFYKNAQLICAWRT